MFRTPLSGDNVGMNTLSLPLVTVMNYFPRAKCHKCSELLDIYAYGSVDSGKLYADCGVPGSPAPRSEMSGDNRFRGALDGG